MNGLEETIFFSILRRMARVRSRGYVGILKRAPVTGEARWHRGNRENRYPVLGRIGIFCQGLFLRTKIVPAAHTSDSACFLARGIRRLRKGMVIIYENESYIGRMQKTGGPGGLWRDPCQHGDAGGYVYPYGGAADAEKGQQPCLSPGKRGFGEAMGTLFIFGV